MAYTYDYPRPSVTTDCVVFTRANDQLKVLLIQRASDPFKGMYAFPGGFLEMDEEPEDVARRELEEETGLKINEVIQIGAFGKVDRDPRGRTISIAFLCFINEAGAIKAASDAKEARWFNWADLPELAFDHKKIFSEAVEKFVDSLLIGLENENSVFDLKGTEMLDLLEMVEKEVTEH
jgi:8-oxo-dGTP diphosphatase